MTPTVPSISLVCFDMAGTTVRDGGTVDEAFEAAMADQGVRPGTEAHDRALAYVAATMGQSKISVFTHLFDGDRSRAEAANAAFEAAYLRSIDAGRVEAVAGAEDVFSHLASRGVKVCLTTGFSPATRDAIVATLGWEKRVDLLLSPADAGRGRPSPDMILIAVVRLAIDDVRQVAVVGDTSSDLLSGSRAGAGIVAGVLTGAHGRAELEAVPHTHILPSVANLPGILPVADGG
jgi:phosphoglycolate phosphatase